MLLQSQKLKNMQDLLKLQTYSVLCWEVLYISALSWPHQFTTSNSLLYFKLNPTALLIEISVQKHLVLAHKYHFRRLEAENCDVFLEHSFTGH